MCCSSEEEQEEERVEASPVSSYSLFNHYPSDKPRAEADSSTEFSQYLEMTNAMASNFTESDRHGCLKFWSLHKQKLPKLFALAKRVISIPASSAPVERVFSQGGLIMRPHRSRLSDQLLSDLVFLKCNKCNF